MLPFSKSFNSLTFGDIPRQTTPKMLQCWKFGYRQLLDGFSTVLAGTKNLTAHQVIWLVQYRTRKFLLMF